MSDHSVGKLADWIIKNRKGNAFRNDTWQELYAGLTDDVKNENVIYVWDDNDNDFIGVVTFVVNKEARMFFVKNILVTKHSALVVFVHWFNERYKDCVIGGNRNDEYVKYNTFRLCHLLVNLQTKVR